MFTRPARLDATYYIGAPIYGIPGVGRSLSTLVVLMARPSSCHDGLTSETLKNYPRMVAYTQVRKRRLIVLESSSCPKPSGGVDTVTVTAWSRKPEGTEKSRVSWEV